MDALAILRILRIALFVLITISLLLMAIRRRAYWWQVLWALSFVLHELYFFIFALRLQLATGLTVTPELIMWSVLLDIHQALAFLVYLAVLYRIRGKRDADASGGAAHPAGSRAIAHLRATRLTQKRQRRDEWASDERAFGRGERLA